eukprot:gene7133-10994_t
MEVPPAAAPEAAEAPGGAGDPQYYFTNGLRGVVPYWHDFGTHVKGRWVGKTVLEMFSDDFPHHDAAYYKQAIERGRIRVDGRKVREDTVLGHNEKVTHLMHRHEHPVLAGRIEVLHDDGKFVAVNKPASIPVHPCGRYAKNTVVSILRSDQGFPSVLHPVHRLDKVTSGVLLFGANPHDAERIGALLRQDRSGGPAQPASNQRRQPGRAGGACAGRPASNAPGGASSSGVASAGGPPPGETAGALVGASAGAVSSGGVPGKPVGALVDASSGVVLPGGTAPGKHFGGTPPEKLANAPAASSSGKPVVDALLDASSEVVLPGGTAPGKHSGGTPPEKLANAPAGSSSHTTPSKPSGATPPEKLANAPAASSSGKPVVDALVDASSGVVLPGGGPPPGKPSGDAPPEKLANAPAGSSSDTPPGKHASDAPVGASPGAFPASDAPTNLVVKEYIARVAGAFPEGETTCSLPLCCQDPRSGTMRAVHPEPLGDTAESRETADLLKQAGERKRILEEVRAYSEAKSRGGEADLRAGEKKRRSAATDEFHEAKRRKKENFRKLSDAKAGDSKMIPRDAHTVFRRVALVADEATGEVESLVTCLPLTGRTHQIRVHLQALGHPIVDDFLYNPRPRLLPAPSVDLSADSIVVPEVEADPFCKECAGGGERAAVEQFLQALSQPPETHGAGASAMVICLHAARYELVIDGQLHRFAAAMPSWAT